ncbi:hypothetical protein ACH5RR_026586 [Cinchona calisaya]|uniref:BZIP domain-containing protein n=1 Tax=Cinchona calisaya TaxID=153742 RepID=A0ABD2Z304_9GENT
MDPNFTGKAMSTQHFVDLDQMPDTPNRRAHHRRAQSETFSRFLDLDDDILLDDVVVFDLPVPSLSSDSTPLQPAKGNSSNNESGRAPPQPARLHEKTHFRSLSVDADFFEGLNFGASSSSSADGGAGGGLAAAAGGPVGPRHRHSSSMDGSSFASAMTASFEAMMVDSDKKAAGADRLQELALIDPKRAKRILANRQSAARSKERKVRYTNELERKVQTLQTEATTLSAQVTMLQRDTTGLTVENKELKLRLQAMEQQAHLRDALNEALREEVQRLKITASQIPTANGNNFNRGLRPPYSSQAQTFHHFGNNQAEQQQQQQQQQIHMSQPGFSTQTKPSFLDFNHKV